MVSSTVLDQYRVIVGIDFGTTYSGAAYCILSSEEVADITTWPKQPAHRYPKAPTASLYKSDTMQLAAWGNAARQKRSQATQDNFIFLNLYKLYLDDSLDGILPLPGGIKPIQLVADYLRAFHAHVVSEMKKGFAQQFEEHQYRYCLTVPAMWSDKSKKAMRDAAILAGLISEDDPHDRLMLISEPEAAAIYCENVCEQFDMSDGDEFMICDAGGGTVDLIVFTVKMGIDGTRRFKESTKGLGKSCGSSFVDKRMRKLLKSKLKKVVDRIPDGAMESMMETFVDTMKPEFDGTDDMFMPIPLTLGLTPEQTEESIGLDAGYLRFTVDELKERVFEPVVQDVLALIQKQRLQTTNLKAIFTVGGFGASHYLQQRIAEEYTKQNIKVVTPYRAELAVARGAAYFGMNPYKVATRVPRYWYGIDITNTFVPGVDPEEYKIIRADGSVRCDNRFSCFVPRGEPLDMDSCITQKYKTIYPCPTACTFYAASTDEMPRYTLQPGVRKVFDFEIPMPVLPDVAEGEPLDLTIKMYFGEVELRVEAVIRGQTYRVVCNFNV
ncbi:hypothetical protein K492DRAFT_150540 [Lichtheimia hyalospora FSU 10163]|nr:hypothetical protein K492DRAFT_150540 [Lichtheimia hyalospora FSU 10163]